MQFRITLVLSLFAAAQVALAQPPACLLAALNQQPNPADLKTICGNKASDVQKAIQSACSGDDKSASLSSFADTCKGAGVTVKPPPPESSSASASPSGTAKATGTSSSGGGASATGFTEGGKGGSSGSSSVSAAGASSTAKTGDAGRVQAGSFAGLVVAAAGVVYVL